MPPRRSRCHFRRLSDLRAIARPQYWQMLNSTRNRVCLEALARRLPFSAACLRGAGQRQHQPHIEAVLSRPDRLDHYIHTVAPIATNTVSKTTRIAVLLAVPLTVPASPLRRAGGTGARTKGAFCIVLESARRPRFDNFQLPIVRGRTPIELSLGWGSRFQHMLNHNKSKRQSKATIQNETEVDFGFIFEWERSPSFFRISESK